MSHDAARRRFLTTVVVATAAAPLALSGFELRAAAPAVMAKALPKLPLTDAAAKALAYTENAAAVKHAAFKPGSACLNCNLYKGTKGKAFGPCTIFPKNTVAAKGWCSAWAKKL